MVVSQLFLSSLNRAVDDSKILCFSVKMLKGANIKKGWKLVIKLIILEWNERKPVLQKVILRAVAK